MKDDFTYITIDEMKILYNMELMFFTGSYPLALVQVK